MATRCNHCDIILTSDEARGRSCPSCGKRFGALVQTPTAFGTNNVARAAAAPVRENLGFLPLFGILFVGGVVFAILSAALTGGAGGSMGCSAGVSLTYGILYGMGYIGNKKSSVA